MGQARIKKAKTLLAQGPWPTGSAVLKALEKIRSRSVAERDALGKMIKCQVCGLRHRETKVCQQEFATRWYLVMGPDGTYVKKYSYEKLIAGKTPETEAVIVQPPRSAVKGKRKNPHYSHRKLQYAQLVRDFTPDEYDENDLKLAKKKAAKIMLERFGESWRNW